MIANQIDMAAPLRAFLSAIHGDGRISITHIGIYVALWRYRMEHGFVNPIQVFSHEIMRIAKLSSAGTYHKCIKDLSDYGYIRYEPSYNRMKGSRVYFLNTDAY